MNMSEATPYIYEAFTEAGIDPAKARKIERAIQTEVAQSQSKTEKQILDRVMTKEDGLRLEQKLGSKMMATVGLATAFLTLVIAGFALLQKLG